MHIGEGNKVDLWRMLFKVWLVVLGFLVYMYLRSVSFNNLLKYISMISA